MEPYFEKIHSTSSMIFNVKISEIELNLTIKWRTDDPGTIQ